MPPRTRRVERDDDYPEERPRRGRRDPDLAEELEGVVRRTPARRTPPVEQDLDEEDEYDTGVHLADQDASVGLDNSDVPATGEFGLVVGDRMVYKVVTQTPGINGNDRWFTFGVESSLQPGEGEGDAFARVVGVVHEGLDQAIANRDAIEEEQRQEALEAARRRRIVPGEGIER